LAKVWISLTLAECDTRLEGSSVSSVIHTAVCATFTVSENFALDGEDSGIAVRLMFIEWQASTGTQGESSTRWIIARVFENVFDPVVISSDTLGILDGHKLSTYGSLAL
tara:strand:- start:2468 stop:2794 length:327 start_codon:yes stop_codon:yes gene_type:complete